MGADCRTARRGRVDAGCGMSYADRLAAKRWRTRRALGYATGPVPSGPVREHIQRLTRHGFLPYSIARAAGLTQTAISRIETGEHLTTRRSTATAILAITPHVIFATAGDCQKVPAYASQRRLRALAALGWRLEDIDAHMEGQRAKAINGNTWVYGKVHRRIAAVYEELSGSLGPSDRTRRQALARGFAPPLAWDDIDDPGERPDVTAVDETPVEWSPKFGPCSHVDGVDQVAVERALDGQAVNLSPLERHRVVVEGTDKGLSSAELAAILHTTSRTITRHRALHASTCTIAATERTAA